MHLPVMFDNDFSTEEPSGRGQEQDVFDHCKLHPSRASQRRLFSGSNVPSRAVCQGIATVEFFVQCSL